MPIGRAESGIGDEWPVIRRWYGKLLKGCVRVEIKRSMEIWHKCLNYDSDEVPIAP